VYSVLDICISTDAGLGIFLLGSFIFCGLFFVLFLLPWFRQVPMRFFVAGGAAIPVIVLLYAAVFELLVCGRGARIMLALSPVILAVVPSIISFVFAIRCKSLKRRTLVIVILSCMIFVQLWAILVLWLATNYGFMGASC